MVGVIIAQVQRIFTGFTAHRGETISPILLAKRQKRVNTANPSEL